MSDIITRNEKAGRRMQALRVDLTPMVDLGFLLITFFVFTTTMSEVKALKLVMPDDGGETGIAASGAFTILPSANKLWYYAGDLPVNASEIRSISYTDKNSLRMLLLHLKQQLVIEHGNDEKLVVMIKPLADASFSNVVDMLDEMKICSIKRYALIDAGEKERELVKQ